MSKKQWYNSYSEWEEENMEDRHDNVQWIPSRVQKDREAWHKGKYKRQDLDWAYNPEEEKRLKIKYGEDRRYKSNRSKKFKDGLSNKERQNR